MASGGFAFNFIADDAEDAIQKVDTSSLPAEKEIANNNVQQQQRLPFAWVKDDLGPLLKERAQEELVFTDVSLSQQHQQQQPLRCVDLTLTSYRVASNQQPQQQQNDDDDVWKTIDIQTGLYEGGRKVWECSRDLVEYLGQENVPLLLSKQQETADGGDRPIFALELGCGHGLPGCFLLREALMMQNAVNDFVVIFTDYNRSVVLDATISNLVLNCTTKDGDPSSQMEAAVDKLLQHVGLGAGDWMDMSSQLLQEQQQSGSPRLPHDGKFDVILAAETIYSEAAAHETARLLQRHLRPITGVAYVATKRYYFGVGGGVDPFRAFATAAADDDTLTLQIETVRVHDSGTSNIREVLKVQCLAL